MAVLGNPRHELAAQAIAAGKSAEEAAAAAGYNTNGRSFKANARKFIQRADIVQRVRELQSQIAAVMVIDKGWIEERVANIAGVRLERDEIKATDVLTALRLLAQMTPGALAPTKVAPTNPEGDGPASVEITWKDPVDVASKDRS